MKFNIISKDLILIVYYSFFIVLGIIAFIRYIKNKRKRTLIIFIFVYVFCFSFPINYIINILPIRHDTIEDAFDFDNGFSKYEIIYMKEINGYYYVIGKSVNKNDNIPHFSCYRKTKTGYQQANVLTNNIDNFKILDDNYIAHYMKIDGKTTIFVSSETVKKQKLNHESFISDQYSTVFDYVVDQNNEPIKYAESNNYIFFGIVEEVVDNDYYLIIDNKKIKWK